MMYNGPPVTSQSASTILPSPSILMTPPMLTFPNSQLVGGVRRVIRRRSPGNLNARSVTGLRMPAISAVRGPVDIIGIARQPADKDARTGRQVRQVESQDGARPSAVDEQVFAVVSQTDPVGEHKIVAHGSCAPRLGIEAEKATVRTSLEQIESPALHIVALRSIAEVDRSIGRDIEIVGHPDGRVVLDGEQAAPGLVAQQLDFPPLIDAHEAHSRDADDDAAVAINGEAERSTADFREGLHLRVVGRRNADEAPIARPAVQIVLRVEDHVLRAVDLP